MTIRLSDDEHSALKEMAGREGLSLSEYVRTLLNAAINPTYSPVAPDLDLTPPETISLHDRQVLVLLHRILGHVLPQGANGPEGDLEYQMERVKVLENGFTGEYWREVAGFYPELPKSTSHQLMEILDMFRAIKASLDRLSQSGFALNPDAVSGLSFNGFDHNDSHEGRLGDYTKFLMETGRWTELREQFEAIDGGNSHLPMLATYQRMLAEYRRIMASRNPGDPFSRLYLSVEELAQIHQASFHPSWPNKGKKIVLDDESSPALKFPTE